MSAEPELCYSPPPLHSQQEKEKQYILKGCIYLSATTIAFLIMYDVLFCYVVL